MNKKIYQNLPLSPGVYLFKDKSGRILYIGKSKSLRKRVRTYFQQTGKLPADKQLMVALIDSMDHIITDTEEEALLLETTLIKRHRPKYNILFKDDKNYKYIKVDYSWDYPKIYTVRKIDDSNPDAQYFGPFTDGWAVNQSVELLRKLWRYRTCNREIPYDASQTYSKPCLNYHIKLCLGPCIGAVTREDYDQTIDNCVQFLQGKQTKIIAELKEAMKAESTCKNFERAAILRDQLRDIEHIVAKQKVISQKQEDLDTVSFHRSAGETAFNVFQVRNGKLIGKENFILTTPPERTDSEILCTFLERFYSLSKSRPSKIALPTDITEYPDTKDYLEKFFEEKNMTVPQRGTLAQLISLGKKNAKEYLKREQETPSPDENEVLVQLQAKLSLPHLPNRIEGYDISNIQGQSATGSLVVFTDSRPNKNQYRRFRIKFQKTPNDVGMLREVLSRRFADTHDDWPRPDLIMIDGGKPQLNIAKKVLDSYDLSIPVVSLAKREEEIFTTGQKKPIKLPNRNPALQLLQRVRDEAHRFAITYHSKLHKKKVFESALDNIPGIGPTTRKALLKKFGSVASIRNASKIELAKVIGEQKAKLILENL